MKMFDALIWWVTAHARRTPQLIILEDAHWCDPTSAELLAAIADRIAALPVLMIVSIRLPHEAAWIGHPDVTRIELERLDDREAIQLVAGVTGEVGLGGKDLQPTTVDKILMPLRDAEAKADRRRASAGRGAPPEGGGKPPEGGEGPGGGEEG